MINDRQRLVSIVLPVHNGEKYLIESIESCRNQTYENWELIIIDDCSTDRSEAIARFFAKEDQRIRYYKNETNLKLPRALNRGFSIARGDYLTWTSDDNYYRPEAIDKMVRELEETKAEFVFTAFSTIDENGYEIKVNRIEEDPVHLIWKYNIVGACFLYSREVYEKIGEYDPKYFLCEDYDYWLRVFSEFPVAYIDENLYAYRKHNGTLTSTRLEGQHEALEKVLLKNLENKKNLTTLDWLYAYRGLHRSRRMQKSLIKKYEYLPKWLIYKIRLIFMGQ